VKVIVEESNGTIHTFSGTESLVIRNLDCYFNPASGGAARMQKVSALKWIRLTVEKEPGMGE
jgi:archaeosine-15-forming tRNA-guanine transglycosylase